MTNKIVVSAAVVLSLVAMSLCAKGQLFLTGKTGFTYRTSGTSIKTSEKTTEVNGPSEFTLSLVPGIGVSVTNSLDLGLNVGYEFERTSITKDLGGGKDQTDATNTHGFVFNPYVCYHLFQVGDLAFALNAAIDFAYAAGSSSSTFNGKTETADIPSKLRFGTGVTPELIYRVSNHMALTASFDLFRVGWTMNRTSEEKDKTTTTKTSHRIDMGFNANKTALTVGMRYTL